MGGLKAGLPCTVAAQWREPGGVQARNFGHRYWVREDCDLEIMSPVSHPSPPERVVAEPTIVYPEAAFETAVLAVLRAGPSMSKLPFVVVPRLGLDIAVFIGNSAESSRVHFVEAKSYGGQRPGGVGFGNGNGEGPQVDVLLAEPPGPLDASVHWAFVDATRDVGTARYALIDCQEARAAAMGGVARGKQNNFKVSALTHHLVGWLKFRDQLTSCVGIGSR